MATPLRDPASWSDASVSKRAATTCNKELRFASVAQVGKANGSKLTPMTRPELRWDFAAALSTMPRAACPDSGAP